MIVTQKLVLPANNLTQLSINMSDVEGHGGRRRPDRWNLSGIVSCLNPKEAPRES